MNIKRVALFLLAALLSAGGTAAAETDAETLRAGLAECRHVADIAARAACYDRLADMDQGRASQVASPATAYAPQPMQAPQTPQVLQTPPAAPVAGAAAPLPAPQVARAPLVPASPTLSERAIGILAFVNQEGPTVSTTIQSVAKNEDNKLRLITTDGIIFDQLDDSHIRAWPQAGDALTLEKRALGGVWCRLNKRDKYSCKAVQK